MFEDEEGTESNNVSRQELIKSAKGWHDIQVWHTDVLLSYKKYCQKVGNWSSEMKDVISIVVNFFERPSSEQS